MTYLKKIFEYSKDLDNMQNIVVDGYILSRQGKALIVSCNDKLEFYCGRWYR